MNESPTTSKYSPVAMTLHWWTAAMIVLQFVLTNLVESAEDAGSEARAWAPLLAIRALMHFAVALRHLLVDREGALRRISAPLSIAVFVINLVGALCCWIELASLPSPL